MFYFAQCRVVHISARLHIPVVRFKGPEVAAVPLPGMAEWLSPQVSGGERAGCGEADQSSPPDVGCTSVWRSGT